MFFQLDDYFTNKGYELLHTAGFLTIAGEPDWFEDEDGDDDDDDDDYDDDDDEYDSDEEDGETYDVVSFRPIDIGRLALPRSADPIPDWIQTDPPCPTTTINPHTQ